MQIQVLPSHKIDKQKWDDCIKQSSNPLIYATSVYLDHMAENWEGFIAGDYNMVMPVPWKKKYGIKYCYHVPFVQQLGVFGKNFTTEQVQIFIQCLKQRYKYGDYSFNYLNQTKDASQHNNYILLLSSKYSVIREFYLSHAEKNLNKAKQFSLQYEEGNAEETINEFRKLYTDRVKQVTAQHYKNFTALCNYIQNKNNLIVRKITNNSELLASVLLMKDERRYYNLMMTSTSEGRRQCAGAFLYDALIQEFSHNGIILDFEGSDLQGVKFFYKGFGAVNQPYCKVHLSNLKFPLNLFKR